MQVKFKFLSGDVNWLQYGGKMDFNSKNLITAILIIGWF